MPRSRVAGPKRMHIFIFNRSGQTTLQSCSHNLCAPRQDGTVYFLKRMGIIHWLCPHTQGLQHHQEAQIPDVRGSWEGIQPRPCSVYSSCSHALYLPHYIPETLCLPWRDRERSTLHSWWFYSSAALFITLFSVLYYSLPSHSFHLRKSCLIPQQPAEKERRKKGGKARKCSRLMFTYLHV